MMNGRSIIWIIIYKQKSQLDILVTEAYYLPTVFIVNKNCCGQDMYLIYFKFDHIPCEFWAWNLLFENG